MSSDIITFSSFSKFPHLVHAISTRHFGSIKQKGIVFSKNLSAFISSVDSPLKDVVFTRQVHGKDVQFVTEVPKDIIEGADGLLTDRKGFFIGMATADCLPIIFYDQKKEIIAVIHAGYKGILQGIIEETIGKFSEQGSDNKDIFVGIGPGIGVCCYNVPEERIEMFREKYDFENMFEKRDGAYFLNLAIIAQSILINMDIPSEHIEILPLCTKDNRARLFSFRGDSEETFGEFATIIGMLPE